MKRREMLQIDRLGRKIYNRNSQQSLSFGIHYTQQTYMENGRRGTGIKCFRVVYSADILHFRQNYVSYIRKTNTSNSNRPHRYSKHTWLASTVRRTLKSYSNGGNVIFQCKFSMVSWHASIYQRLRVVRLLCLCRIELCTYTVFN